MQTTAHTHVPVHRQATLGEDAEETSAASAPTAALGGSTVADGSSSVPVAAARSHCDSLTVRSSSDWLLSPEQLERRPEGHGGILRALAEDDDTSSGTSCSLANAAAFVCQAVDAGDVDVSASNSSICADVTVLPTARPTSTATSSRDVLARVDSEPPSATPAMPVQISTPQVYAAAEHGDRSLLQAAVQQLPNCLSTATPAHDGDSSGNTPFHVAAAHGHVDSDVLRMCIESRVPVDLENATGCTAMHLAALHGHARAVSELLTAGSNIDKCSFLSSTALIMAAYHGRTDVIELLLRHGAAVELRDCNGCTALYAAAQCGHNEALAALLKHFNAQRCLEHKDVRGCTALYAAAQHGHLEAVALLRLHGASVNAANRDGCTPLFIAASMGHTQLVQHLLTPMGHADGVAPAADVDARACTGASALFAAAQHGHIETIDALLSAGASLAHTATATVTLNSAPLYAAVRGGHGVAAAQLMAWGAQPNESVVISGAHAAVPLRSTAMHAAARSASPLHGTVSSLEACIAFGSDMLLQQEHDAANVLHIAVVGAARLKHVYTLLADEPPRIWAMLHSTMAASGQYDGDHVAGAASPSAAAWRARRWKLMCAKDAAGRTALVCAGLAHNIPACALLLRLGANVSAASTVGTRFITALLRPTMVPTAAYAEPTAIGGGASGNGSVLINELHVHLRALAWQARTVVVHFRKVHLRRQRR